MIRLNRFKNHKVSTLLIALAALSLLIPVFPLANAGGKGASLTQSSPRFTAAGATVSSKTTIGSMPPFNFFEVYIKVDSNAINPTSISLTGSVFPSPSILADCINGVGSGCTITDGPGIAHIAVFSSTGASTTVSKGLLFTTNYVTVNTSPGSAIAVFCFQLINAGVLVSGIKTVSGAYGSPPKSAFTVTAAASSVSLNATDTVTVTSVNLFVGNVTVTSSATAGLTVTPASAVASLFCQATAQVTLTISGAKGTTGSVTVTGTSGRTAHSITITVTG